MRESTTQAIAEESSPPESDVPTVTSLRRRSRTASKKRSRNASTASGGGGGGSSSQKRSTRSPDELKVNTCAAGSESIPRKNVSFVWLIKPCSRKSRTSGSFGVKDPTAGANALSSLAKRNRRPSTR